MPQFIIKDFLAIKEVNIKVKGLTILAGDSNAGKSSILKAIKAACHNRFKLGQVRHEADFILVKLKWSETDPILSVVRRPTGSPTMILGNQTYSKLTRTVPPEVEEYNNLGQIS